MKQIYQFKEAGETISPALIYYKSIIEENIQKAIAIAGSADHLWPHVKTHKMAQMVQLQMKAGIRRFKCATIAEAEMAADCAPSDVLIAYPLVGPNIKRFIQLQKAYPKVQFWSIGDEQAQLERLGTASAEAGLVSQVLIDVNMGMNRTGVALDQTAEFYTCASKLQGLKICGLHCYDGHRTEHDIQIRRQAIMETSDTLAQIRDSLVWNGIPCDTFVMGGSPSFPCYADFPNAYFSPGTLFVNDYGYTEKFPDLKFTPGAAILTRVISCPQPGHFTLDLGYKGIASDPVGIRGVMVDFEHAEELFQSEEHWAFRMKAGFEALCPSVGTEFYVIPTHICPTSALYPSVLVVENGKVIDTWEVTARNRKITY